MFHIGSARTVLFNYVMARKEKGTLILRIEDTDKERSKKEYESDIMRSIKWLGLDWDEGPIDGGEKGSYGPYRQSERNEVYEKYLQKLLSEDKAYRCYCSKEELGEERKKQLSEGKAPLYSGKCASLKEERAGDFVIRFRCPKGEQISFDDMIRGKVSFESDGMGDFAIGKSDFSPLYNFAVVVDDYEMKVTHVVRGEDHISNTPRQILLQKAMGFDMPLYGHLPLILGHDKSKLSKRHGAVSVYDYKEQGYLPEAMVNFISFLGWNPGGEKEVYSLDEIIENFDIKRCKKGGAIFNIKKLDSINSHYISKKDDDDLANMCLPFLLSAGLLSKKEDALITESGEIVTMEKLKKVVSVYKERMIRLSEIPDLVDYFFKSDISYGKELLQWKDMSDEDIISSLERGVNAVRSIKSWNLEEIESMLIKEAGEDKGSFLWPFRVALSGKKASASPFEIAWILGPEETEKRLKMAIKALN